MNNVLAVEKLSVSSTPVISLADAKAWLKIDGTDDDAVLQSVIDSVIEGAEAYTCKSIRQAALDVKIEVNDDAVFMPYGPVIGDISVFNSEGQELYAPAKYGDSIHGLTAGVYSFVYNAGWVTVPASLKMGLLRAIAFVYENRGDEDVVINYDEFLKSQKSMAWV